MRSAPVTSRPMARITKLRCSGVCSEKWVDSGVSLVGSPYGMASCSSMSEPTSSSGSAVPSCRADCASSRRARIARVSLDFMVVVLDGVSIQGCEQLLHLVRTWRTAGGELLQLVQHL